MTMLWRGQVVGFGDATDYMTRARELLTTGNYSREPYRPVLPFFRVPLYPLLIALVWTVAPESILAIKVAHVALFAGTCHVLYLIGLLVFQQHRAASVGALVYALNPLALYWLGDVQSEPLFTFLIAGGVFFLTRMVVAESVRRWDAVFAGVMFGLASLSRPTGLWVGLIVSAIVLKFVKLNKRILLLLACLLLTVAPWTMANFRTTGEFMLLNDAGGYTFYFGNHPLNLGWYQGDSKIQTEYVNGIWQSRLTQEKLDEWQHTHGYWSLPFTERERLWFRAGWGNLRAHPWLTMQLWGYKALDFWRLWLHPQGYPLPVVILSGMVLFALYALAIQGALLIQPTSSGKRFLLLLAVLFITVTGIHMLTHTQLRYRLPFVEPYLSILAGQGVLAATTKLATSYQFLRKKFGTLQPRPFS